MLKVIGHPCLPGFDGDKYIQINKEVIDYLFTEVEKTNVSDTFVGDEYVEQAAFLVLAALWNYNTSIHEIFRLPPDGHPDLRHADDLLTLLITYKTLEGLVKKNLVSYDPETNKYTIKE